MDPRFYIEALGFPRRRVMVYFVELLVFSALLSATADTWYLVDGERGIPRMVEAAFPGMAIRNGILHTPIETPYIPPSYLITPILNQLLGLPKIFNHEADSIVVVDTAESVRVRLKMPAILLKARKAVVVLGDNKVVEFPYENILFGARNLEFRSESVERFLKRHIIAVFLGYFLSALSYYGALFFFSIFFLAIAAYIFRIDRKRTLGEYVKTASFAISSIAVGSVLVSLSGVKIAWMIHVLILAATIVMFRAIIVINAGNRELRES